MSRDILLSLVDPDPGQPRKHFDAGKLAELADSMRANGLAVPILLRPSGDRLVIVHGARRYRAALSLGWESIPAEVRDVSPDEARWLALVENVQRADLSPIEEAQAYQERLSEDITQAELGQRIGKSQSYIAQKLRLLRLPDDVQTAVGAGDIAEGHARQILRVKDAETQSEFCQKAVSEGWSVARIRLEIDEALKPKAKVEPTTPIEQAELAQGENTIETYLAELKKAERPPDSDNLLETAIWAEQRTAYLNTLPITSLLERQNDYAIMRLYLERAAGKGLTALESGESDLMTWSGLEAIIEQLKGREPSLVSHIVKRLYKVCPGIRVWSTGLEFPENTTFEQWHQVGSILREWERWSRSKARGEIF